MSNLKTTFIRALSTVLPTLVILNNQRFSTWGTQQVSQGVRKIIKRVQIKTILLFGGTQRGATLIWGYTEGYNFDLGVRKYQKVENP